METEQLGDCCISSEMSYIKVVEVDMMEVMHSFYNLKTYLRIFADKLNVTVFHSKQRGEW